MAENYDLIFGQSASQQYAWSDSDYQNGWQTVGSTPPTAEQFDALQRRSDTKAQELNSRLTPIEAKAEADGRQMSTAYALGDEVTADGLPNGFLLECVVAGTSGASAITIPATLIDGVTIVDNTVTWKLRKVATEGGLGYRQPSTTYAVGDIAYHASLPTGWYLECTTAGTTSAGNITPTSTIGGTVSDGTVVWKVCKDIGTGNAPLVAGFNAKQTFTSSGSFTAPVTGIYRITLQGAGGGGGGCGASSAVGLMSGAGGGQGGYLEFYEKLTAGTSYSYTIGAGGVAGTNGTASTNGGNGAIGGSTSITINDNTYICTGGNGGNGTPNFSRGGTGGISTINGTVITRGANGESGNVVGKNGTSPASSGTGGGTGAGYISSTGTVQAGIAGGGGGGGVYVSSSSIINPSNGGDGYITFEWLDTSLL